MLLEGLVIPVSFDTGLLLQGIDLIKDTVAGAVEATFDWANELDSIQDIMGNNADAAADWNFVLKKSGVQTSALTSAMTIFEKGLRKADGSLDTIGKSLESYGISLTSANGHVKDQDELLRSVSERYMQFGTQQERVNFLTEVFGRSGAGLVDFFDTLAAEGGIDAVTQKVQDFGLAIDPARYEQFQRNLEEIKMAGLGLQVAFTEKLMPTLEGLLQWGSQFMQADWSGKMQMIADQLSQFSLPDITQKFRDWVAGVDWFSLSTDFADGMNKVPWAEITKQVIDSSVNIMEAIIDLVERTNWSALGEAFRNAMTGVIRDGIGKALVEAWIPAAEAFWRMVDRLIADFKHKMDSLSDLVDFSTTSTMHPGGSKRASGGSAGGMTWVGERGPELVNLPGGSFVNNAAQSAAMQQIDYEQMGQAVARHLVPALQVAGIG